MDSASKEQIRQFRLHTHHLDKWYQKADVKSIAGACGFQNTPPGTWETALHNRISDCSQEDMRKMLEADMYNRFKDYYSYVFYVAKKK